MTGGGDARELRRSRTDLLAYHLIRIASVPRIARDHDSLSRYFAPKSREPADIFRSQRTRAHSRRRPTSSGGPPWWATPDVIRRLDASRFKLEKREMEEHFASPKFIPREPLVILFLQEWRRFCKNFVKERGGK